MNTGKIQHTFLAGAELDYEIYDTNTARQTPGTPAETLNIYHPDYAALPPRSLQTSRMIKRGTAMAVNTFRTRSRLPQS
jgi:iron complex outermembrane receptor protein